MTSALEITNIAPVVSCSAPKVVSNLSEILTTIMAYTSTVKDSVHVCQALLEKISSIYNLETCEQVHIQKCKIGVAFVIGSVVMFFSAIKGVPAYGFSHSKGGAAYTASEQEELACRIQHYKRYGY